jgi:hypothetical protein
MLCKYWSPVQLACYDDPTPEEAAAAEAAAAEAAKEASKEEGKVYRTQEEVNRYVAEDRRKTEAKYKAQLRAELQKQEKTYNDLLSNKNLTEQERDNLRSSLDAVETQLLSEKEKAAKDKKKLEESYTGKLTEAEKNAKSWETRYKESSISRELQAAAVENDAFNARQMIDLLRPKTELAAVMDAAGQPTGEFQVMVEIEVEGKPTKMTPADAVKKLRDQPEWSNLFKANVVSGLGKDTGATPGANGKIDVKNMSQADYRKLRKTNPELIFGR